MDSELRIRELSDFIDLERCESLERIVWGLRGRGGVPASQLAAAVHAGGLVAGAFDGPELVAYVYGFPSYRVGAPPGHHSHILAVLPPYRKRGVGQALKAFQRAWCLARGIVWMTWTFDPMQHKNARFNLEHLGAEARAYRADAYGVMEDALNAGLPSDRLLAYWDLKNAAARRSSGLERLPHILAPQPDGAPAPADLALDAPELALYVPDLPELRQGAPELATSWRLASRRAFLHYLNKGYVARGFGSSRYLLAR